MKLLQKQAGGETPGMCRHILGFWRIKKGKLIFRNEAAISSQVKVIRTMSRDKLAITLWPYQPVCILLFDSLLSFMTEQLITMILSSKRLLYSITSETANLFKNWLLFSLHCISIFRKSFTRQLATDTVTFTHQRKFLLAFGAWRVFLGPVWPHTNSGRGFELLFWNSDVQQITCILLCLNSFINDLRYKSREITHTVIHLKLTAHVEEEFELLRWRRAPRL